MTVINTNIAETINITQNGQVDVARYTTANVNVQAGGKYHLLDRVKDDSNNEIGTVCGFHVDANNNEYAVVCLDGQYRLSGVQYLSDNIAITDLPQYSNLNVYGARETATYNCDKILAQATTSELTSPAVSHCRSQTFTINSIQYAAQLPTLMELLKIYEFRYKIQSADPSHILLPDSICWSSSQVSASQAWVLKTMGETGKYNKTQTFVVLPILELPNA